MKALIIFSLSLSVAFAQETIQTGRPGQSIGAAIVPTELFQIQSGLEINETKVSSVMKPKSRVLSKRIL